MMKEERRGVACPKCPEGVTSGKCLVELMPSPARSIGLRVGG